MVSAAQTESALGVVVWRYCKAAWYSNGKVKPNVVIVESKEETHREGSYYLQRWPVAASGR